MELYDLADIINCSIYYSGLTYPETYLSLRLIFVRASDGLVDNYFVTGWNNGARISWDMNLTQYGLNPGFLIVVAVDPSGAPFQHNVLAGKAIIRRPVGSTFYETSVEPLPIKKLTQNPYSVVGGGYDLSFDGVDYERLPGVGSFASLTGATSTTSQTLSIYTMPTDATGTYATWPANCRVTLSKQATMDGFLGTPFFRSVRAFSHQYNNNVTNFASSVSAWNTKFPVAALNPALLWLTDTTSASAANDSDNTAESNGFPLFGVLFTSKGTATYGYIEPMTRVADADPFTFKMKSGGATEYAGRTFAATN